MRNRIYTDFQRAIYFPAIALPEDLEGALRAEVQSGRFDSVDDAIALAVRRLFGLRPAPEFAAWLEVRGLPTGDPAPLEDGPARRRMLQQLGPVLERAERIA